MLQTSTVKESTLELLKRLQAEPLLSTTRLVGGTAQGLLVQSLLIDKYGFQPSVVQENTLIGFIHGVKIDVRSRPCCSGAIPPTTPSWPTKPSSTLAMWTSWPIERR